MTRKSTDKGGRSIGRRTFLYGVGATAGTATVGFSGQEFVPNQRQIEGSAEAIAPLLAGAAIVKYSVAAGAGYAIARKSADLVGSGFNYVEDSLTENGGTGSSTVEKNEQAFKDFQDKLANNERTNEMQQYVNEVRTYETELNTSFKGLKEDVKKFESTAYGIIHTLALEGRRDGSTKTEVIDKAGRELEKEASEILRQTWSLEATKAERYKAHMIALARTLTSNDAEGTDYTFGSYFAVQEPGGNSVVKYANSSGSKTATRYKLRNSNADLSGVNPVDNPVEVVDRLTITRQLEDYTGNTYELPEVYVADNSSFFAGGYAGVGFYGQQYITGNTPNYTNNGVPQASISVKSPSEGSSDFSEIQNPENLKDFYANLDAKLQTAKDQISTVVNSVYNNVSQTEAEENFSSLVDPRTRLEQSATAGSQVEDNRIARVAQSAHGTVQDSGVGVTVSTSSDTYTGYLWDRDFFTETDLPLAVGDSFDPSTKSGTVYINNTELTSQFTIDSFTTTNEQGNTVEKTTSGTEIPAPTREYTSPDPSNIVQDAEDYQGEQIDTQEIINQLVDEYDLDGVNNGGGGGWFDDGLPLWLQGLGGGGLAYILYETFGKDDDSKRGGFDFS